MEPADSVVHERPRIRPSFSQRAFRIVRRYGFWFALLLIVVCSGSAFELGRYSVYQANPQLNSDQQATEILARVGALIQLPQDETPTMATITNATAVKKTQPFLASAENGDVLIVYPNAETAILYRPSTNKLIAVGPVTSGTASQPAVQQTPVAAPVSTPSQKATATSTTNASTSKSTK